jgi:hypothetical protein
MADATGFGLFRILERGRYRWCPLRSCTISGAIRPELLAGLDDALKAFAALRETPEFFRWYIERYLIYQHQGPAQALRYIQARIHDDTSYTKIWKELNRADRAILLLAARGVQDLYGVHALEQLKDLMGSPNVTVSAPRTSLRRLTSPKQQLLARVDHGAYRFEDPEFQARVSTRRSVD